MSGSLSGVTGEPIQNVTETFRISVDIQVGADPVEVFDYVSDLPKSGQWSPECQGGTWVAGQPLAVGSVFRGNNYRRPGVVPWAPVVRGEWTTEAEIVESSRPRVFSWAMRDSSGARQESVWSFEIRPASGGSVLTHAFWMGKLTEGMRGILSRMSAAEEQKFLTEWAEKIDGDLRASLARIKSALESGAR